MGGLCLSIHTEFIVFIFRFTYCNDVVNSSPYPNYPFSNLSAAVAASAAASTASTTPVISNNTASGSSSTLAASVHASANGRTNNVSNGGDGGGTDWPDYSVDSTTSPFEQPQRQNDLMNNVNATIVGAIAGDGGTGSGNSVNNNSADGSRGAAAAAAAAVAAAAAAVASARGCNANNTAGSCNETSQQLSNAISITTGKLDIITLCRTKEIVSPLSADSIIIFLTFI